MRAPVAQLPSVIATSAHSRSAREVRAWPSCYDKRLMGRALAIVVVAGCYRNAEQPQDPIVLHPPGSGETVATETSAPLQVATDRPTTAIASSSDLVLLGDDQVTFNAAGGGRAFD